jgi:hypothetical protein
MATHYTPQRRRKKKSARSRPERAIVNIGIPTLLGEAARR